MKKLILGLGLFVAVMCAANASICPTITQGQGTLYDYTDTVYGYTGSAGEITSVSDPLIAGSISAGSGGFATITIDVDTDFASDFYDCGTLPNNETFSIDLM